jgi:hypothetical protein
MPFSAPTGVAEAALAGETTSSDQAQPASRQAVVSVLKRMSVSRGLIFNSRLETAKDMKLLSPVRGASRPRNTAEAQSIALTCFS